MVGGVLGLSCALGAAVVYGLATILQAVGAQRVAAGSGLDPRLLLRLSRSAPYVAGLALDAVAFALTLVALRHLPVYVVQSAVSANLAVVAVLAGLLGTSLTSTDWLYVAAVGAGLVLVAASAGPEQPAPMAVAGRWALLAAAVVVVLAAAELTRRPAGSGPALGLLAGLEFGIVALAARVLPTVLDPLRLLRDPSVWALAVAGVAGTLVYATALQRGPLTATSAAVIGSETLAPAVAAAILIGDLPRPGWLPAAVGGVALVLAGAGLLARHEPVAGPRPAASRPD
jgi:drug/metabolite transporter (DMT)-like permease